MIAEKYEFPNCVHALSAGFHMLNIDPQLVTISLPREQWWKLLCTLESKFRGVMKFNGLGTPPDEFKYMGISFRVLS